MTNQNGTTMTNPIYGPNPQQAPQPAQPIIINNTMANDKRRPKLNHPLHIILTILTGGIWLLVYIPLLILKGR